jgi:Secretion system C-terminal sorting domain
MAWDQNSALDICTNENYVWIVGNSSKDWTFEQFDEISSDDYYRALQFEDNPNINEASIARFDIQYMIQTSEIDLQINNTLDVYPNPSEGRFTVIMPQYDDIHNAEIAIFNSLGQIMERVPNSNDQKIVIDLTKYARGIYCLRLTGLKTSYSASLIKL